MGSEAALEVGLARPRVTVRRRAREDILRQQEWYIGQLAFEAAESFGQAVHDTASELAGMPGMGRSEDFAALRSMGVRGFEAVRIYYLPLTDGIDVVRVLHTAREVRPELEF